MKRAMWIRRTYYGLLATLLVAALIPAVVGAILNGSEVSPAWALPMGCVAVAFGAHLIHFRAEHATMLRDRARRHARIGRIWWPGGVGLVFVLSGVFALLWGGVVIVSAVADLLFE